MPTFQMIDTSTLTSSQGGEVPSKVNLLEISGELLRDFAVGNGISSALGEKQDAALPA